MRIGFAKTDITPPIGTELGGYAGYRPCTAVHDGLYCKAVVLEQGETRYALVALDLLCVDESLHSRIADAVAHLGITKDRLIACAIHSHAAPVGIIPGEGPLARVSEAVVPASPDFGDYMEQVVAEAARACEAAAGATEPFLVRCASGPLPPIGSERHTGAAAAGKLTAMECRTESGKRLILYNLPCHPTVLSAENTQVSADFAGDIEGLLGAELAVFLNGAAGDISTRFTRRESTFAECARFAALAADSIQKLLAGADYEQPLPLTGLAATVLLKARPVEAEEKALAELALAQSRWEEAVAAGEDPRRCRILKSYVEGAGVNLEFARSMGDLTRLELPVRVFRLWGLSFATVPGELFSTLLPEGADAVITYANGYYRYIADERAYDAGYYEALAAILGKGGGEILKLEIQRLLAQLTQ